MLTPSDVLHLWFGAPPGERCVAWFRKDPLFDEAIRTRFLTLYNRAAQGRLHPWTGTPAGSLALIVLTDQCPRNMFRGEARAFASDPLALATARLVVAAGWDKTLLPVERQFVYLPFEHSESLQHQEQSLTLFQPLGQFAATADAVDYARRHWEIVKRFGRFPHRNAALGRQSTAEEVDFLQQPGSGF